MTRVMDAPATEMADLRNRVSQPPRRDALAEEQIAAARGPMVTQLHDALMHAETCEQPGCAGMAGFLKERFEEINGGPLGQVPAPPMMPQVVLRGEDQAVFAAFADACAKIEANQRAGADLMREYQAALQKVSAMAARHAR